MIDIDSAMNKLAKAYTTYENVPVVTLIAMQKASPYKILITTILSARTKDQTTLLAAKRLFTEAPDAKKLAHMEEKKIEELIYPVGFYKTKAKHIKETAQYVVKTYNGQVPDTMEALLELPGVGRKTANLVLGEAFQKDAMCVDTHVHRISNRFGYVQTKNPQETEMALRKKLPQKYWIRYNTYLVAHGQKICTPISPKCSECALQDICPKKGVEKRR